VAQRPSADAARIFVGIGSSYERVGALMSLGQDAAWRRALVERIDATRDEVVLDVATGTGLVARALTERYGCRVVGLDRSRDMLAAAVTQNGHIPLVHGRAERLPFGDATFDHVTFTYLLRYVDDPAATMRELARVVRPGGRVAMLEFGVPRGLLLLGWRAYTRLVLPLIGRLASPRWREIGAFLGPNIERFYRAHSLAEIERAWRDAGLSNIETRRMSFGAGVVMTAVRRGGATRSADAAGATETLSTRETPSLGRDGAPRARGPSVAPAVADLGVAFYALRSGSWRDYWTLLHPPYTAWHLSYVVLGSALAPMPDPRIVAGALVAFFLAVGVAAHAFDELQGRPLGTRIPSPVLVTLGAAGLLGAVALGIIAATQLGFALLAFVAVGAALVVLYGVEAPIVHSDLGFALGWGAFPVLTAAFANGAPVLPAALGAFAAALVSLAQRRLSTPVRRIRRKATDVSGTVTYRDGAHDVLDRAMLIAAPEAALRLLWLAMVALSIAVLVARWS
jgi:demethylmenaquinone methyltransferase/2-methoxy-6-polyprenyl-1,4-benzoquinol methylase